MSDEPKRPAGPSGVKPDDAARIATLREQLDNLRKLNAPQELVDLVARLLDDAEAALGAVSPPLGGRR